MDIRRLDYFLDLAETRNYSETAERMFTTQSNVSKQIQALEKELDTVLVDRSKRRIGLTAAGEILLPYAKRLVKTDREMRQAIRESAGQREQVLRIHTIPVLAQYHVTELIAGFTKAHPDIRVEVTETEKTTLEKNLENGECDVIYTRIMEGEIKAYDTFVVDRDRYVGLLSKDHMLCGGKEKEDSESSPVLALSDLKEEPFLLLDEKTGQLSSVCELCRKAGFEPRIAYKGVRIDTILGMVASNMGVSILMEKTVPQSFSGRVEKRFLDRTLESELVFQRKAGRGNKPSRAVRLFWDFLNVSYSGME